MIGFLIALHPRCWRDRYGTEFRALLEANPMTAMVILDVLRNAARQHATAHVAAVRFAAAAAVSIVVEVAAVRLNLTDNILWLPTTPQRAVALAALLAPWLPVASATMQRIRRHRAKATTGG